MGTGEQSSNFEGNRGTKTILGNREHKKTNFRFLGNRGTSHFISGEQGNRYPHPLGGPHYLCLVLYDFFQDANLYFKNACRLSPYGVGAVLIFLLKQLKTGVSLVLKTKFFYLLMLQLSSLRVNTVEKNIAVMRGSRKFCPRVFNFDNFFFRIPH